MVDPRSPLVIDTREIGRRPGTMRALQLTVPAPEALGVELIGIPAGAELQLDIRLEAVMEGVLVSGRVRAVAIGECGRCLDRIEMPLDLPIQELYVYPEQAAVRQAEGDDEEQYELDDDHLDLELGLRDAVVLALPFQPVCSPDCPGLCSQCGARLADDPDHHHDNVDPRWAALQSLTDEKKES